MGCGEEGAVARGGVGDEPGGHSARLRRRNHLRVGASRRALVVGLLPRGGGIRSRPPSQRIALRAGCGGGDRGSRGGRGRSRRGFGAHSLGYADRGPLGGGWRRRGWRRLTTALAGAPRLSAHGTRRPPLLALTRERLVHLPAPRLRPSVDRSKLRRHPRPRLGRLVGTTRRFTLARLALRTHLRLPLLARLAAALVACHRLARALLALGRHLCRHPGHLGLRRCGSLDT